MGVGQIGHERLRVDVGGHDDDAVDSSTHGSHGAFDLAFVVVGIGDDDVIAGAAGGNVDSTDDFGEELTVEVGEENSDGTGTTGNEAPGAAVWDIAERGSDVADAATGFFADWAATVKDSGDCGNGDAGFASDIPDRDYGSG
jgi:hypothetical protein